MATGRIGTTPVLQVRWSKAPSAGTTSLSGLDDNSVSLVYSVGYEAVYRNGVLLSRTNDYTATDGTTVTLIDATIAGDIIEIFANQTIPLSDTYSQTVANGKFINNTLTTTTGDIIYASAANTPARLAIGSTGQVLKVSGGVPSWGAISSSFVGCYVYNNANITASSGGGTVVTFNQEAFDTDAFHSTSSNTGRITIPVGKAGKYLFTGAIRWNNNGNGRRLAEIIKNVSNTTVISSETQPGANQYNTCTVAAILDCSEGDYFQLSGYQDSGGNLNILASSAHETYFQCTYLGA
jgi:hypothetical protein